MGMDYWGKSEKLEWPKLENGEPVAPALLCETSDKDEFQTIIMFMRGCGIPVIQQLPGNIPFTTVIFGSEILGGSLYVPETLLEDAKILLKSPPPEEEL